MTSTPQLLARVISAALLFGLASASALADHHVTEWDQAQVTAIAAKLPKATEALYTALYTGGADDGHARGLRGRATTTTSSRTRSG